MKKSRIVSGFMFLAVISFNAFASESEYNSELKVLTIPTVKIGNSYLYDAALKLNNAGSFNIISYSRTPPSNSEVNVECTEDKIILDKYNQITTGMTLEQVNSIIGCKGELSLVSGKRSLYNWVGIESSVVPKISIQVENNIVVHKSYAPPR